MEIAGDINTPEHIATQIRGKDFVQMSVVPSSVKEQKCTMRITKTKKEEYDAWRARVLAAGDTTRAIYKYEEWKMLLGDRYREIMVLKFKDATAFTSLR